MSDMTPLLMMIALAAGLVLLADTAVRSWKFPGRVEDPGWFWPRPAPVRSVAFIGPLRAPRHPYTEPNMDAVLRRAFEPTPQNVFTLPEPWDPQARGAEARIMAGPAAIAAEAPDPELLTSVERAAAEEAWIRSGVHELRNALDQAVLDFRAAVEPAMRTARLWDLRGHEGMAGKIELDRWRMETPTGEWPIVRQRPRAVVV